VRGTAAGIGLKRRWKTVPILPQALYAAARIVAAAKALQMLVFRFKSKAFP
jgi:hypothetical protein